MRPIPRPARFLLLLAAAGLVAPAARAAAQAAPPPYPGLTLTFLQPTGTGAPTTPFDIWVRATLDPGADPLRFDGSSPATDFGLPAALIPTTGNAPDGTRQSFATYDNAYLASGYGCTGDSFTSGCTWTPYIFGFNGGGQPAWQGQQSFTLLPGGTYDFLIGTLTPQGPGAPPGTYTLPSVFADFVVYGTAADGTVLYQYVTLAETCSPPTRGCEFTRTVVADAVVPEPAAGALLGTGLLALAGVARTTRRRPRRA